ncbi:MAG: flavodoxin, partial [Firmicutes bacterium]|nr:flavodoxin [Bacillota bacterium]
LYIFCLPGILMRFLQLYKAYADARPEGKTDALVYTVVNCGFPEPHINEEAVRVVGRFADAVGGRFRFGVMIGGGGMYGYPAPQVRKKLSEYRAAVGRIWADLKSDGRDKADNILIQSPAGRRLYYTMGNMGWKIQARKHNLKKADLYARPYQRADR